MRLSRTQRLGTCRMRIAEFTGEEALEGVAGCWDRLCADCIGGDHELTIP